MIFRSFLLLVIVAVLQISHSDAHGRLTSPQSRQAANGLATFRQNEPVTLTSPAFICRDQADPTVPVTETVTAGSPFPSSWQFDAAHVGDCFLYMSYDLTVADPSQRQWFKISNLLADQSPPRDCRKSSGTPVTITLPAWLPPGQAIIRWEWYALHVRAGGGGSIEYYAQCADVTVRNAASPSTYAQIEAKITPKFTIGDHLPTLAADYRSGFSPACDDDLRKCSGKGGSAPLGDNFLVGPEVASFDGVSPTPGGGNDAAPAPLFVCAFVWMAMDCAGSYTESFCRTIYAASCDASAADKAFPLPATSVATMDATPFKAFDECAQAEAGLMVMWTCHDEVQYGPGTSSSSSSDFGPGFATGFGLTAGLLSVACGVLVYRARRGSTYRVPRWTGILGPDEPAGSQAALVKVNVTGQGATDSRAIRRPGV